MPGPQRLPCETPRAFQPVAGARPSRWILPATILGSSMSFIDGSVVNVALPSIQSGLQASLATAQWVINGYLLALAALILLGGALGDRFGERRIFMAGLGGFVLGSLACGLAPTAAALIAARLVQGLAAALLVPSSLAILGSSYAGEERGRAIGTWAAAAALTTALGPPLGGWLVDAFGWRSVFFVNVPVGLCAFQLSLGLPTSEVANATEPLDVRGAILAILALGLPCYGIISIGEGSTFFGLSALAAGAISALIFIRTELHFGTPMLSLSLFRNRSFSGANSMTVLLYAALSGALFILPYMLIEVDGYSAAAAGAALLPFSIVMGAGSRSAGALVDRFGPRTLLTWGPSIVACGYLLLSEPGASVRYWRNFFPGLTVAGIGMTLSVAPLTTTVFVSSPKERSGIASGINNAAARAGSLLAVAALGLAFGPVNSSPTGPIGIARAYVWIMISASALAALSGLVAALFIARTPTKAIGPPV